MSGLQLRGFMLIASALTERVIAAAIEVHRHLGAGLLEATYRRALAHELTLQGFAYRREVHVPVVYKGHPLGSYRIDFVIERTLIVEVKSVERHNPVFEAQVLTYLRAASLPVGLLINFNSVLLTRGVRRFVLTTAARQN